jgi:hypothetical protein
VSHVAIVGGPADGLATRASEKFARLDVVVLKRPLAGERGELYELLDGAYVFAGGRRSLCECGTVFDRAEGGAERQGCPLCNA